MKNKKKVVGLLGSAVLFGVAGVLTGLTGSLPVWFSTVVGLATTIAGGLGISLTLPNKGE